MNTKIQVLRRKKDEQMRKIALLAEQYENSVLDLNQKQNVGFYKKLYLNLML